ncbi:CAP domain-containing protein [Mesorhizobium sp. ZC-5]|uniref:CAP domain-containing protein n=1 Tax=Mesorhizobium sp. ZC-5 TaxID=2986066 RepID=UPI0021E8A5C4|nr:CAP domain-containing protein [Mesorhizobium sp. ZC-5]MCV3240633.1 CAP domain-containing protein [Mesorhizobium sp. ZC-5]
MVSQPDFRLAAAKGNAANALRSSDESRLSLRKPSTIAAAFLLSGCTTQPAGTTIDFGAQALTQINSYRASRGLSPLASNGTLKALARQHSQYQAARGAISHSGFRERSAQAKAAGLSGICTENVGYNYRSAQHLVSGWKNSAGHNTNLLRPNIRYAGVSVVGDYATFFACG